MYCNYFLGININAVYDNISVGLNLGLPCSNIAFANAAAHVIAV